MKYWNKDKDIRRRCWTQVSKKRDRHPDSEIKRWCQQQSSTGKFYYYYGSDTWWFEDPKDAMWFTLRWL